MSRIEYIPLNQLMSNSFGDGNGSFEHIDDLEFFEEIVAAAVSREEDEFYTEEPACSYALENEQFCNIHIRKKDSGEKIEWRCAKCSRNGVITDFDPDEYNYPLPGPLEHEVAGLPPLYPMVAIPEAYYEWLKKAPLDLPDEFIETLSKLSWYNQGHYYWETGFSVMQALLAVMETMAKQLNPEDKEMAGEFGEILSQTLTTWMQEVMLAYSTYKIGEQDLDQYFYGFPELEKLKQDFNVSREQFRKQAEQEGLTPQQLADEMQGDKHDAKLQEPDEALGGLTHEQYFTLIANDWSEATPGVIISADHLQASRLEKTPIIRNLRLLMKIMLTQKETLPLTKNENMKQKDVARMLDEGYWISGYPEEVRSIKKTVNEIDAFEIHEFRILLMVAKLLRKHKNGLVVMKKNKRLLESGATAELYRTLLTTWMNDYNFAYRLGNEDDTLDLQYNAAYYLYLLCQQPEESTLGELAGQLNVYTDLFPRLKEELIQERKAGLLFHGLIRPLYYFGMMEIHVPENADLGGWTLNKSAITCRKTPLMDEVVSFSI